jgi:hypothetical protein
MAERDKDNPVILFSDLPGDERKVRAILADWGVAEDSIKRLLTEARVNHSAPTGSAPMARTRALSTYRRAPRTAGGH